VSESESRAKRTTESVESPARVLELAHPLTPASQPPVIATSFGQDGILSIGLTQSQSQIGGGSYKQENGLFPDFLERGTSATAGHSSSLFNNNGGISMAESDYTGQSSSLGATPQDEDEKWDKYQHSDEEDICQQPVEIPPLYPMIYGQLGFPIVDQPLEYRLRLSDDRSGVGWPLKRWRGDETDLLADETIDIGVVLGVDGLSSPTLWEETTTNSRWPYSRCPSATNRSSFSYRFDTHREPDTTFSAMGAMVGSPDMAFEEECVQERDVVPLAYQLVDDSETVPCSDTHEGDVERCSPQSQGVTLDYQEPDRVIGAYRIIGAYLVQCPEPAFDPSQEPTEMVVLESKLGDVEMKEATETEKTIQEDETGSEVQIESIQEPVHEFVLAPDLFGD
jgi:hypothetical protein